MTLVELSNKLQYYCHEGRSLDRVILEYNGKHLVLDTVEVKNGKTEEDVVLALKEED